MGVRKNFLHAGDTFEFRIMDVLKMSFPQAVLLHDKEIECTFLGKPTQIDNIVVTPKGVFVLEAKNWKHWIQGSYNDHYWTGMSSNLKTMTVFNPIHQNFIHIRTIRNALRECGVNPPLFHNLVVMPDGTEIKSDCSEILNFSNLIRRMRNLEDGSREDIDVAAMCKALRAVLR